MQFNQPPYGNAQPFYNYFASQFNTVYPEIIGEGDVTSVSLPDGTVRYFFTPAAKWWAPHQFNHNINYNTPNIASWYIRSIPNQMSNPCNYPNPLNYLSQRFDYPGPCITDCNINSFHLKLHSDACTSTTDMHYFYPNLRPCYQVLLPAKENVTVQANIPAHRDTSVWCVPSRVDKPCNVSPSLSVTESKRSLSHKRNKGNLVKCECDKTQSKTVVNRGANTTERLELRDGCGSRPCCSHDENASELWIPNSSLSKNAMQLF